MAFGELCSLPSCVDESSDSVDLGIGFLCGELLGETGGVDLTGLEVTSFQAAGPSSWQNINQNINFKRRSWVRISTKGKLMDLRRRDKIYQVVFI